MSGRPELQIGHVVRNRLIGRIGASPITVICGLFGTGKGRLLGQWYDSVKDKSRVMRVDLPQRHLSESQTVYRILEHIFIGDETDELVSRVMDQLRRGNVDPDRLRMHLHDRLWNLSGRTLLLTSYEWQSTAMLDQMLVDLVKYGINVVCALLDAGDIVRASSANGVSLDIITDADLAMDTEELSALAEHYGIEPDAPLIWRIMDVTGGHPALSALMLLRLSGVLGAVYENGSYRPIWGQEVHSASTVRISPNRITEDLVREACGFLRVQGDRTTSLLDAPQGNGGFMRTCRTMMGVKRVGVAAVASIDATDVRGIGEGVRGHLQRLVDAGYGAYEVGADGELEFVWKIGIRRLFGTYLEADRQSGELIIPISSWYAHRGRLQEFLQMVADGGEVMLLEAVSAYHFIDVLWGPFLDEFEPDRWKGLLVPRYTPAVMLLTAMAQLRHGELDESLQRGVEAVFCSMRSAIDTEGKRASMSARDFIITLVEGEISTFLLGNWSAAPDWERWIVKLLHDSGRVSELDSRERSRLNIQTGLVSLIRMHLSDAETGLARAGSSAAARSGKVRALAGLGLRVLEDVTGDDLGAERIEAVTHELETVGLVEIVREESLTLMELARTWDLMMHHSPEDASEALTSFIEGNPRSAESPIVRYSLEVMRLFAGQYVQAYAALQRRPNGGLVEDSPYSDLMFVVDGLVLLRSGRALENVKWPNEGMHARISPILEALQALYENDTERAQEYLNRIESDSISVMEWPVRFRVWLDMLRVAVDARHGDLDNAARHFSQAVSLGTSDEMVLGLRLISHADVLSLSTISGMRMVTRDGVDVQRILSRSLSVGHILPDGTRAVALSGAQLDVLRKVARGLSNQRIAEELFLSVNTVKSHLRNIYRLLGARNRHDAVDKAHDLRLL